MFNNKPNPELDRWNTNIDDCLEQLKSYTLDSDERKYLLRQLETFEDLKRNYAPKPLDRNVLIASGTNLAGILLILNHERANVIATKAIGFVSKLR